MRKDKLPKEVFFSAFDFGLTGEELEELYKSGELEEIIAKTLSDDYGFCVNSFSYFYHKKEEKEDEIIVSVSNIDWDTSE